VLERICRAKPWASRQYRWTILDNGVTASRWLRSPSLGSTMGLLPIARRCLGMCEEWWIWRRRGEAEEARWLWDEFERTRPVGEPERMDEREVTLEEREATATAAES
jgi:hypothetical protein